MMRHLHTPYTQCNLSPFASWDFSCNIGIRF
jgi:hypothetical protein